MRVTDVSPVVEAEIVKAIEHWLGLLGPALTSEGGRVVMRNEFLRQLQLTKPQRSPSTRSSMLPTRETLPPTRHCAFTSLTGSTTTSRSALS